MTPKIFKRNPSHMVNYLQLMIVVLSVSSISQTLAFSIQKSQTLYTTISEPTATVYEAETGKETLGVDTTMISRRTSLTRGFEWVFGSVIYSVASFPKPSIAFYDYEGEGTEYTYQLPIIMDETEGTEKRVEPWIDETKPKKSSTTASHTTNSAAAKGVLPNSGVKLFAHEDSSLVHGSRVEKNVFDLENQDMPPVWFKMEEYPYKDHEYPHENDHFDDIYF